MQAFRALVKELLPPILTSTYKRLNPPRYGWFGNYPDWRAAQQASTGYDSDLILDRVKNALLKVKRGKAVYERDSVLFEEIEYSWPLLASLLWVAAQHGGKLNVLDFGGSLGSTYFQNRAFLKDLKNVRWNVVEQENFVQCGKTLFEDTQLKFYYSIEACLQETTPDVILLSCVLPYVEKPYELLSMIVEYKIPYIIFDRMPFFEGNNPHRITVHKVNPALYEATIPTHFFNKREFIEFMQSKYEVIVAFDCSLEFYLADQTPVASQGFIYKLP